jgi:very-short-patch-repair endonuclease
MPGGLVEVVVPGVGGRKKRHGIGIHRSRSLVASDVALLRAIPITTVTRTIADLRLALVLGRAGSAPARELRTAIRQGSVLGLPLGGDLGRDRTRSDLERDFLSLCRRHGLPALRSTSVSALILSISSGEIRLVVETDGYRFHRGQEAFRDDRRRGFELTGRCYEVVRLSEQQIDEEPDQVAETLAMGLAISRQDGGRRSD